MPALRLPVPRLRAPGPALPSPRRSPLHPGSWSGLNPGAEQTSEKRDSSCLPAKKGKVCVASKFPEKFSQHISELCGLAPSVVPGESALCWPPHGRPQRSRCGPQAGPGCRGQQLLLLFGGSHRKTSPFPQQIVELSSPLRAAWVMVLPQDAVKGHPSKRCILAWTTS